MKFFYFKLALLFYYMQILRINDDIIAIFNKNKFIYLLTNIHYNSIIAKVNKGVHLIVPYFGFWVLFDERLFIFGGNCSERR